MKIANLQLFYGFDKRRNRKIIVKYKMLQGKLCYNYFKNISIIFDFDKSK